jgi:hypothetical protein
MIIMLFSSKFIFVYFLHDNGKRHTIAACNTRGVYTMQTKGANHTPNTSQSHIAICTSSPGNIIHGSASEIYNPYFRNEYLPGEANDSGRPKRIARDAAREKLRTEAIDITVEAKHRFRDFRRDQSGATFRLGIEGMRVLVAGMTESRTKKNGENI